MSSALTRPRVSCSRALRSSARIATPCATDSIELVFVQLVVSEDVLAKRLNSRAGHYAGPAILPSQLATLEPGDDVVAVNGELPPDEVADAIVRIVT